MKDRLRIPAEWEPHAACWLAFPYLEQEWQGNLPAAQQSIAALCRAIAEDGNEPVQLLVKDEALEERARALLGDVKNVEYLRADYGDCWTRDTAPVFGSSEDGDLGALCFEFNGWGGKFPMPHDDTVGQWLCDQVSAKRFESALVLEGGALEPNGRGVFLTTASCVLNENRNPGLRREAFERALSQRVQVERLIWLERGLQNDHTDGHIDMLARFATPEAVFCMSPKTGVPNERVLREIQATLQANELTVLDLPAPRLVKALDGSALPTTYCNFYIANEAVIVPTYGIPEDEQALREIGNAFPKRELIGLPARDLLCGGGAFHCATQPMPALP